MEAGTRLGPYEIVSRIGAGGMGEVWRARDTRLGREVAIKVLPAEFAGDAKLRVRFDREAKTISHLSHPNICTLFDVGENYIVMELLEGETLAERLTRGALPLSDVFRIAIEIAHALGRAHQAGVAHRDLKPGNIMLTRDGAKLLDFGLAKQRNVVNLDGGTALKSLTEEGTILGTLQYMAPEQLEGADADARADIFALGAVLYEMVTGKHAFDAKSRTSLIAAIVSAEPAPLRSAQPLAPAPLEHIVRKCLQKDPDARWQSANDIAELLQWTAQTEPSQPPPSERSWRMTAAVAVAAAVVAASGAYVAFKSRVIQPEIVSSEINPPAGAAFDTDVGAGALSPDGRKIAFVARRRGSPSQLWIRSLDSPVAVALNGTENSSLPFWSPDSRSLGFFADGKLKRINASGGAVEVLAAAVTPRGGSWGSRNVILFAPSSAGPIYLVSASGGDVRPATTLDLRRGDASHRFPAFLPNGRNFLAFVHGIAGANILLASIDSKETRLIGRSEAGAVFAPPDWVLLVQSGMLRAQHFDVEKMELVGEPIVIADAIQTNRDIYCANASASENGMISYVADESWSASQMKLVDRSGKEIRTFGSAADQLDPRIAPDGSALVFTRAVGGAPRIWMLDLRRNVETQLTSGSPQDWAPVWSPDSKSIVYTSLEKRAGDLILRRIGASTTTILVSDDRRKVASDWSRDGRYVIFQALSPSSAWDVDAYFIAEKKIIPLVHSRGTEILGQISPDGKWLAYASDVSGTMEVYVQDFPAGTQKWQISSGGGTMPRWSNEGRELDYWTIEGKLMATSVRGDNGFVAGPAQFLFEARLRGFLSVVRNQYDVTADQRFITNEPAGEMRPAPITLVQNWTRKIARP